MGRLFAKLKKAGIDENTIVIFTSDNGPHKEGGAVPDFFKSPVPLRGIKRDLYEGGIRVPMIARWPGKIKPGTVSNHISAFWDFLPTAAQIAGVEPPEQIDGISFLPALLGEDSEQQKHDFLYWEYRRKGGKQALRTGDWKAVYFAKDKKLELYNLKTDTAEQYDVAEEYPAVVARVKKYLKAAHTPSKKFPASFD